MRANNIHTPSKKKKKKTKRQLLEDVTFLFSSRSFFFFQLHSLFVFVTCFTSFSLRYLPIGVRCEVVLLFGSSAFAQLFFFFFFPPSLVCSKQTKRRAAEDSCTRSPSQYTNIKSSLTICFLSFLFFFFETGFLNARCFPLLEIKANKQKRAHCLSEDVRRRP